MADRREKSRTSPGVPRATARQVSSGKSALRRNAVGQGDGEQGYPAGALQVAVRADGTGAEENEREGAEKFGSELLEGGVHGGEILTGRESTVDS